MFCLRWFSWLLFIWIFGLRFCGCWVFGSFCVGLLGFLDLGGFGGFVYCCCDLFCLLFGLLCYAFFLALNLYRMMAVDLYFCLYGGFWVSLLAC